MSWPKSDGTAVQVTCLTCGRRWIDPGAGPEVLGPIELAPKCPDCNCDRVRMEVVRYSWET